MKARALLAAATIGGVLAATGCAHLFFRPGELATLQSHEPDAKRIGAEECSTCHEPVTTFFQSSMHKKDPGCENCHGAGQTHAEEGEGGHIVKAADLRAMTPRGKASMCTTCHVDRRAAFPESAHAKAGLSCQQCHTDAVHFKQKGGIAPPSAFIDDPSQFCVQCHAGDVAETAQPFHHPLASGEVQCNDCHAIHGEDVLRADRRPGAACGTCHADEAGPKVFRHDALDDGCGTCHTPHGSAVPALLKEDGNGLCLSCHLEPGFPVIEGVDHRDSLARGAHCLECHVEIHGSNSDPSLLGRIR